MLLVVDEERHWVGFHNAASLKLPDRLAGERIEREEIAFVGSAEDNASRRRQQSSPGRGLQAKLPTQFSGRGIESANRSVCFIATQCALAAASEERAGFVLRFALVVIRTHLTHWHKEEFVARVIAWRKPIRCALQARPHQRPFYTR